MAWTEDIYENIQPHDPHAFHIFTYPSGASSTYRKAPQQPTTILQQLPDPMMPPDSAPSIRPGGHVKEDLVDLMMIQNAQMHQVIMNNMTTSALRSFGYFSPATGTEAHRDVVIIQENEVEPEVHHHYYKPAPHMCCPPWALPQVTLVYQGEPNKSRSAPPHSDRPAVAPPPPSFSTSQTMGHHSAPAEAKSNSTATSVQQPISTN